MRSIILFAAAALALIGGVTAAQQSPDLAPPLAPTVSNRSAATAPALPAPGQRALTPQDVDAWLDGYMPYALHTGDIAGAVVVVVKDGQVVTKRGYGYADVAKRTPVDPDRTLFRPGSVSKLVTWTAVMQQVEAGRIDLDADVNQYLDFKIPARDGKPITMRQIMTHTAGFEEHAKDILFYDPKKLQTLGDYVKTALPQRIFAPGVTPAYSNYATTLAAYIVERVSKTPFDTYVEQRIFTPLGMAHSSFRQPLPKALAGDMATGYHQASGEPAKYEFVGPAPAGSLSATGADMGRFMISHLNQAAGLLKPETAREMHDTPLTILPPLNRMELGFFETNINGRQVIGHLGDTDVFHTSLHLFMREGTGFYVSFSSAGKGGAVGPLRGALFQDFADRYFPNTAPADGKIDAKTAAAHAQAMTGHWINSRKSETSFMAIGNLIGQVAISVDDKGGLVVPAALSLAGQPVKWVEIAPYVWRSVGGHDRLAAKVVDGKVVRWSLDMMSPFMVFDRAPASQSAAWIMPLLYASLAILLLTFLQWPISALIRRRYKAPLQHDRRAWLAYRGVRLASGLVLGLLIAWAIGFTAMLSDFTMLGSSSDWWLWLLQILGVFIFLGGVALAGWNAWRAWTGKRGWFGKLWSVLLLVAMLAVLHVAWTFGLLAMSVTY